MIAAGVLRKWSSSKGLSKARLMDTQRYTRKVKTCEKDLAKAKENLEKWGPPTSASIPSNIVNGTVHASSSGASSHEDPKSTAETHTELSNPNTVGVVMSETTTKPKPVKGNITDASCHVLFV